MLDHHPDIAFPGEFDLPVQRIADDGTLPTLAAYHEWLRTDRHFLWHELEIDPALDYPALVRSFLAQMQQRGPGAGKAHVGASVHHGFEHLPRLWPEARFIHMLRDPRDVGASIMVEGWAGNHFTGARRWRRSEEAWDRLRSSLREDQWIEVTFEGLAAEPIETLTRICEFIGVPYREEMLTYSEHTTYSQVDPGVGQRWRKKQTPREVQLSEAGAGEMLVDRGYSFSEEDRLAVGALKEWALDLHCRFVRLRWRMHRYGLRLWTERRLAQAIGSKAWQDRITLREHQITNRHMK